MFYLTPVMVVMRLSSETLPSSCHRQHFGVDKTIEEHGTRVGSALPQNGHLLRANTVGWLLWEGRNERKLGNGGCS